MVPTVADAFASSTLEPCVLWTALHTVHIQDVFHLIFMLLYFFESIFLFISKPWFVFLP